MRLQSAYGIRRSTDWSIIGIVGGILAGVALIIVLIVWSINDLDDWKKWCNTEAHGHWIDHTTWTSTTTYVDGKPHYGTSSNTTYYCLNEAGGIIDIYG